MPSPARSLFRARRGFIAFSLLFALAAASVIGVAMFLLGAETEVNLRLLSLFNWLAWIILAVYTCIIFLFLIGRLGFGLYDLAKGEVTAVQLIRDAVSDVVDVGVSALLRYTAPMWLVLLWLYTTQAWPF